MAESEKSTAGKWGIRRVAAVLLCPLGVAPYLAWATWEGMEMYPMSLSAALWDYVVDGLMDSYALAALTGVIVFGILAKTKMHLPAGRFTLLFMAAYSIPGMIIDKSFGSGVVASVLMGLPTVLAYCLIVGTPWRTRRAGSPPEAAAR